MRCNPPSIRVFLVFMIFLRHFERSKGIGNTGSLYGKTCVLKQALPDGWAHEEGTNSIRFCGAAVPPFRSVIEVGYTPEEES